MVSFRGSSSAHAGLRNRYHSSQFLLIVSTAVPIRDRTFFFSFFFFRYQFFDIFIFANKAVCSRPKSGDTPYPVLKTDPHTVYLQYNCFYMIEICVNARTFLATPRGLDLHPQSGIGNNVYGYDLNTGDHSPKSHQGLRREASCPGTWKTTHTCPEPDQSRPWKTQGQWFTHQLESGTDVNAIQNLYGPLGQPIYSDIRYSCDEFPPATWSVI